MKKRGICMGKIYDDYSSEPLIYGYTMYQLAEIVCEGINRDIAKPIVDAYLNKKIEEIEREFIGINITQLPFSSNRCAKVRGALINAGRNSESIYDAYNISNNFCEKPIFDEDTGFIVRMAIEALIIQIKRQRELYENNCEKMGVQMYLAEHRRNYFKIDHKEKIDYVRNNISEIIRHLESRIITEGSLFLPTENKPSGHRGILIPVSRSLVYALADYTTLDLLRNIRDKDGYRNAFDTLFINRKK